VVQPHGVARPQRSLHGRGPGRLDPDHPGGRPAFVQPGQAAGQQASPADRDEQHIGSGPQLIDDLNGDGALPGDRPQVVEGRHLDRAGGLGDRFLGRCRLVVGVADEDQIHPVSAQRLHPIALLPWSGRRAEDAPLDAQPGARVGHPLAVITRGRADHAGRPLGRGERAHQVVGATQLVGTDRLQVLALEQHLSTGQLAQPIVVVQLGPPGHPGQAPRRLLDVGRSQGHASSTLSGLDPVR